MAILTAVAKIQIRSVALTENDDALFFDTLPGPAFYAAAACIICATLVVALKDKVPKPSAA